MNTSLQALSCIFHDRCDIEIFDLIGVSSNEVELIEFLTRLEGQASIKELYLSEINGQSIEAIQKIAEIISHPNNKISKLFLAGWEIASEFRQLTAKINVANHLSILDVSHCGISDINSGFLEFSSALIHSNIRELYLDENQFGDDGAHCLAVALSQNPSLEILSVKHCKISSIGMIHLFNALDQSKLNENSSYSHSFPQNESVVEERIHLKKVNTNLQGLFITDMTLENENNQIIRDLALQCASMLMHNFYLTELDLSGLYFYDPDFIDFYFSLLSFSSTTPLFCSLFLPITYSPH